MDPTFYYQHRTCSCTGVFLHIYLYIKLSVTELEKCLAAISLLNVRNNFRKRLYNDVDIKAFSVVLAKQGDLKHDE